jgi:hypothetical protein
VWTAALLSTVLLIAFSLAAGFSIGPFTILLPVLLTQYSSAAAWGLLLRVLVVAAAAATYWLIIWGFRTNGGGCSCSAVCLQRPIWRPSCG